MDGRQKERTRVSIVDDDENDRALMTRAVDRSPDLQMAGSYCGGAEALKGIPPSATQVVLMDVRMPGMDGIECARQLRNVRPDMVIVLISGFDPTVAAARAREAGADAYLAKPLDLGQFLEVLTVCLPRRESLGIHAAALLHLPSARTNENITPTPTSALLDQASVFKALRRMIGRMEENFHTREDLLQEALVYLWLKEQERSGQTRSWYLQGVRAHLKDFQRSGRSIDSPKRSGARISFPENGEARDHWRDSLQFDEGFLSAVAACDIISLLTDRLNSRDQRILGELAMGHGACEIAAMLRVSHAFVAKRHRQIAKLAIKLGLHPLPADAIRRR